ncbi:alpha/beta fold hydrolase [Erythrobacter donghaensis]|jgi:pimeloyl-ACP methyl ester carboxylesterase|uniref:alpha/beta fold hydrolase n=1 Tax=Erythrobacter donghaensis TaxID=267135 RepID=UPI00093E8BBE|nr:alpha/beta fold hydrolase [Erythrobacter donghaensis]
MDDTAPPPLSLWLRELPITVPIALSPLRRPHAAADARDGAGQPVMVIPGILTNDSATALLRGTLVRSGYRAHASMMGFLTGIQPKTLARAVERLAAIAEAEQRKVALLGWSLGGLYARVLAQRHPDLVELVMTLGTPFSGDRRANNAWRLYEAINDHKVNAPPVPDDPAVKPPVPTIALWSRKDGVIAPASARGQPHERDAEVEVPFHHFALASTRPAIERVVTELGQALAG